MSLPEETVRWHLGELGAWEANSFHVDWEILRQARGFPGFSVVKNLSAMQEAWVQSLGWEDPLQKGMAIHSSMFA